MKPRLPPGPRSAILQIPRYLWRADLYYRRCFARYGDPFTEPTLLGPQVVTGGPAGARELFSLPPEASASTAFSVEALLGPSSLMVASGEAHRRGRRLLAPIFGAPRLHDLAPILDDLASRRVRALAAGGRYHAFALAQEVTLDVIMRILFGVRDPRNAAALRAELAVVLDETRFTTLASLSRPWLRRTLGALPPWSRLRAAIRRIDALLDDLVEHGPGEVHPDSAFAHLLAAVDDGRPLEREALRDHLMTLLLAGHETTATSVAWGIYELCRHPAALAELRRATDGRSPLEVAQSPYAQALTSEVLRLHPIIGRLGRALVQPRSFCGYDLPAGVSVALCIDALHRDPALYPDPDRFAPARFLERSYATHEYAPFGGGVRRCIGAALARFEVPILLSVFFRAHDLELVDAGEVVPARRLVSFAPRGGVPIRVRPRAAATRVG
ncbi:MAG: cytochrome P450 [Nannocystaceae bacterium]